MKITFVTSLIMLLFFSAFNRVSAKVTPDLIVAKDGSGNYTTLQAAIDIAPDQGKERFVIYIKNGLYNTEKLIIPENKTNLVLVGENSDKTIISYHIYDCKSPESENKCPAESWALWKDNRPLIRTSATLTILASDCLLQNLTVENTAGPVGQALAVTLRGDRIVFRDCRLIGYQDTVFMWSDGMRNYFKNCLVVGRTDYIYGGGIGYFQSCEIRSYGGGWITAPSTPEDQPYGFVFNNCNFTYSLNSPRPGDDGKPVAIGRPWHKYPKVTILNSEMGEEIHPEGWPTTWNMEYADSSGKLHLYEYNNTGKGADMSKRAKWVGIRALNKKEVKNYTIKRVLGGADGWIPEKVKVSLQAD
ncbi:MAG: pectinesterase family protein [Bacteroides sp.]|nr:pectinesterase family protein [Bacteroides sp.]